MEFDSLVNRYHLLCEGYVHSYFPLYIAFPMVLKDISPY